MHYSLGFKSNFIAAADFGGKEPTVTISAVTLELLEDDKGEARDRLVAKFEGKKRGWVINKTNAILLAALCANEDTDGWIGRRVTLCSERVSLGGQMVSGIRVKGSPDLAQPLDVRVKLPKKKERTVRLLPTKAANAD